VSVTEITISIFTLIIEKQDNEAVKQTEYGQEGTDSYPKFCHFLGVF
jgi:hypothetical protein